APPIPSQSIADSGTDLICCAKPSKTPRKPSAAIVIPRPIKASADIAALSERGRLLGAFMHGQNRSGPRRKQSARFRRRDHVSRLGNGESISARIGLDRFLDGGLNRVERGRR